MKKSLKLLGILLGTAMIAGLAGCNRGGGGGGELTPEEEAQAIQKTVSGPMATISGATQIISGTTADLSADTNDNVTVQVKRTLNVEGKSAEVTIDWSYNTEDTHVSAFQEVEGDPTHKVFYFYYPTETPAEFSFTGTPKCGTTTGDPVTYKVNLKVLTLKFDEYKLSEILELNAAGDCFKHVTNPDKGYWESNQETAADPHMYVKTYGKVVYLAPDGNWGLIADGEDYFEIYAGNQYNLKPSTYPDLVVGNWVEVRGRMSDYQGNVQMSFVSMVTKLQAGDSHIGTEPAAVKTIDEAYLNGYNQFNGDMNALFTVTGTYAGNVTKGGSASTVSALTDSARATFDIKVGAKTLTIAYDYHTSKNASSTLFAEMKAVLEAATENVTQITIKGTLRFVYSGEEAAHFRNAGFCQLVPFLAGDVTAA